MRIVFCLLVHDAVHWSVSVLPSLNESWTILPFVNINARRHRTSLVVCCIRSGRASAALIFYLFSFPACLGIIFHRISAWQPQHQTYQKRWGGKILVYTKAGWEIKDDFIFLIFPPNSLLCSVWQVAGLSEETNGLSAPWRKRRGLVDINAPSPPVAKSVWSEIENK